MQFVVGIAGLNPQHPIADHPYTIFNQGDFLNGLFDDLMAISRLGVSFGHPSIGLVDKARKQAKENREKSVGLRGYLK
jgi:hypothetical protein